MVSNTMTWYEGIIKKCTVYASLQYRFHVKTQKDISILSQPYAEWEDIYNIIWKKNDKKLWRYRYLWNFQDIFMIKTLIHLSYPTFSENVTSDCTNPDHIVWLLFAPWFKVYGTTCLFNKHLEEVVSTDVVTFVLRFLGSHNRPVCPWHSESDGHRVSAAL